MQCTCGSASTHLCLLVDPVESSLLPALELLLLEPQVDLLLGVLDAVGTVADVAADVLCAYILECRLDILGIDRGRTRAKSPRMVPGAEARGLVAPRMARPVLTASRPSQTMAQMGPELMSDCNCKSMFYCIVGLPWR
jgi:hypothetical protein